MVCVIGLGEIGAAVLRELVLVDGHKKVCGCDIDKEIVSKLKAQGFNVSTEIQKDDIYIITVYTTEQVKEVISKIAHRCHNSKMFPLISIESTTKPGTLEWIKAVKDKAGFDLVLFPHRFNPKDLQHHIFNLDRLLGGFDSESVSRALKFYSKYMPKNLIHTYPIYVVELAKVVENVLRYMEIATAEELDLLLEQKGWDKVSRIALRNAVNTKWNIDLKEARDGIGGKCLSKDMKIFNEFFSNNFLFQIAENVDVIYKRRRAK